MSHTSVRKALLTARRVVQGASAYRTGLVGRRTRLVWRGTLSDRFAIGSDSSIAGAQLTVRGPVGCSVSIGSHSDVHARIVLERSHASLIIGSRTHIGGGTLLDVACGITIGDDVLVSFDVLIMDHGSHSPYFSQRKDDVVAWQNGKKDWKNVKVDEVIVGSKCWLGARSTILAGVHIGEGSVVGAGSVVTKDVPPWVVVAGNPARIIRSVGEDGSTYPQ